MLWMTAVVDKGFWSFFAGVNLRQHGGCRVRLTKVSTKSALAGIDGDHNGNSLSAEKLLQPALLSGCLT